MGHGKGKERRAMVSYADKLLQQYREQKGTIIGKLNEDLACLRDVQKFAAARKITTPKGDFEKNVANNEKWMIEWISLYDLYERLLEKKQIKDAVGLAKRMQDLRNWLQVNTTWLDGFITAVCAIEGKHPSEFFKWWDAPETEEHVDKKAMEDLLYHMETDNCPYNKGPCCPENCQYEKGMDECPVHAGEYKTRAANEKGDEDASRRESDNGVHRQGTGGEGEEEPHLVERDDVHQPDGQATAGPGQGGVGETDADGHAGQPGRQPDDHPDGEHVVR